MLIASLALAIAQSISGRIKYMCSSSLTLCYGHVRSCVIHNCFAWYDGEVICACCAKKTESQ